MLTRTDQSVSRVDAVFIGWQPSPWGGAFPLYNITQKGHPWYGSTVSDRELRKLKLNVPEALPPVKREHEPESMDVGTADSTR